MSVNEIRRELTQACARFADLGPTGRAAWELWESLSAELGGDGDTEAAAALRDLRGAAEATGRAAASFTRASHLYTDYGRVL